MRRVQAATESDGSLLGVVAKTIKRIELSLTECALSEEFDGAVRLMITLPELIPWEIFESHPELVHRKYRY